MKKMLIIGCLLMVLVFSACSAYTTAPVPAPSAAVSPETPSGDSGTSKGIEISGYAFTPSTLTIPKGTTITWTNKDSVPHTIVSDNKAFASERLSQDDTFTYTFDTPGTYSYYCSIHPSMKGTIIVE